MGKDKMAHKDLVDTISKDLKISAKHIWLIVDHADKFYRDYLIPKGLHGATRRISQPSPELKTLQYWIERNILRMLPVSDQAFAYRKGRSIKDHIVAHKDSSHVLHIDIKDFFPSIRGMHLKRLVEANAESREIQTFFLASDEFQEDSISKKNINAFLRICLRYDRLCIGAVSSPSICNAVLFEFDKWAEQITSEQKLTYTRYADDLYISSEQYIDAGILDAFSRKLGSIGFVINNSKTKYMSRGTRRKITGLILTPESNVGVGLKMRDDIKHMIYKKFEKNEGNSETILGYLSYLQHIEPDTYNRLVIKYSSKYGDIIGQLKQR